jgi:pimeloyl-ACP methyl ester carboxylesterase
VPVAAPSDLRPAALADAATLPPLDPHRTPWPGRQVTAGGVTLHVRETPGAGDVPAVYLHGLSGSATNWTDLAALLATRAAGTAVDLPGFGLSRPLPAPDWSPAGVADAIAGFLAARPAPVHLVGNSLGGAVALHVAARRPELVRTLTLVSPAVPDLRPDPRRLSDPRLALALVPGPLGRRARAQLVAMDPRARVEQVVRLCFGDPSAVPAHRLAEAADELVARVRLDWARAAADGTAKALLRSWWRGESLWAVAARVQAPTLVVWGDRDRLVSSRLAPRTAAAIPGSRLLVLPGVGHVPQMEEPVAVARAVAALWDESDRGPRPASGEDGG